MPVREYTGSCHCGNVRFRAKLDLSTSTRCNCTICNKTGWINCRARTIQDFYLISPGKGDDQPFTVESAVPEGLGMYQFGRFIMKHFFCPQCGCKPFIVGTLPPIGDLAAVNVRCLDLEQAGEDFSKISSPEQWKYLDGKHDNWQAGLKAEPWTEGCW